MDNLLDLVCADELTEILSQRTGERSSRLSKSNLMFVGAHLSVYVISVEEEFCDRKLM